MDYVQSSGIGNGVASPVVSGAFPDATTSGNTVVVSIADDLGTPGAVSVTDSLGNAYYRAVGLTTGGSWPTTLTMWYATNITGGANHTLTATFAPLRWPGANDHCRFVAQEFTGVLIPERAASQTGTGTAVTSGATAVTSQDHELLVGGLAVDSVSSTSIGLGDGWAKMAFGTATRCSFAQQSRETETTGAKETAFTINPSQVWAAGVIAFASPLPARPNAFFDFL